MIREGSFDNDCKRILPPSFTSLTLPSMTDSFPRGTFLEAKSNYFVLIKLSSSGRGGGEKFYEARNKNVISMKLGY